MQERRDVPIRNLYVDGHNPRHDPIDNEPEILAKLVSSERVLELARNIADNGLSPLERLGAVAHPDQKGRYVVLEGNRRVCAILLMADPERAPTEILRKAFRDLRRSSKHTFETMDSVVVFESREEAQPWLRIRHGYAPPGVATKVWNAVQKTRLDSNARAVATNPNMLALQVLDYATKRGLITSHDRTQINLTTLTRYLSNSVVRDALGLAPGKELALVAPAAEVDVALKTFLDDARENKRVTSRSDVTERRAYAHTLREEKKAAETPTPPQLVNIAKVKPPSTVRVRRDNMSPNNRTRMIPPSFQCRISDSSLKRICDEAKKIDHEIFPFSANYLLRALIELSTKAYCRKFGLAHKGRDLHLMIGDAARHMMKAEGLTEREVKALLTMSSNPHSGTSPDTLGAIVHGGLIPTRAGLNSAWDTVAPNLHRLILATQ